MARDDLDIPIAAHAGGPGQHGSSWRVSHSHAVLDPASKRLLLIAAGVGGTLALLVGGYSLTNRHGGGIPVVEADHRPLREKPLNPGGLEIAGTDDAILGGSVGQDGMAPAPEAPAPGALLAQERVSAAASARATQAALAPAGASLPTPMASTSPAPAAQSAAAPVTASALPGGPKSAVAAMPKVPPVIAAAAPASAGSNGGTLVQLAALPTEQGALMEWQRLSKKMPDMLGSRHPAVSRTERDGKTYFRLRTGGFSDVAQATAFCQRLREKGAGCSIASF